VRSGYPGAGSLYRLDPDLTWQKLDSGYDVTNGPTFSLDGMTMYHTDSAARTIYAFDFGADGSIGERRVWLRFEPDWGYPDGMTTDAEGCIWVAHWDGARVSRFSPSGQLLRSIELPARNITSCTFAGPLLDRMFVTSSTINQESDPNAGALFEVCTGVVGIEFDPVSKGNTAAMSNAASGRCRCRAEILRFGACEQD
jgi:sugar lactone lactonase YvrE